MDTLFFRRHTREPLCRTSNDLDVNPEAGVINRGGAIAAAAAAAPARSVIGFAGLAAGSGATTLAFAAAEYLAAKIPGKHGAVTLLELDPRPEAHAGKPYDKVGIDRRFAGREFIPFHRLASEGKPLREARNIDGGINWALRTPGDSGPTPSGAALLRLRNNAIGDIVICDIPVYGYLSAYDTAASGSFPHKAGRDTLLALLADLDHLICVFDPLPSRLLASVSAAEACRVAAAGLKTTYVFNKMNPGVNIREVLRFTGVRKYVPVPSINAEAVYAAEYACRSLAAEPEMSSALSALFD